MDILGTLLTLLAVGVGAAASLGASWFLQNRQFRKQRLDKARENVYGPLSWELKKMYNQVTQLEYNPSCEVANRIRNQDHLEWMIESKELRVEIARLYDGDIPEYRDTIYSTIRVIQTGLDEDLSQQVTAFHPDAVTIRDIEGCMRTILAGLAWTVLQEKATDPENRLAERRTNYERLHTLLPQLAPSSFDDYLSKVTPVFQVERTKVREHQARLLDRIVSIQQNLEKLLKP